MKKNNNNQVVYEYISGRANNNEVGYTNLTKNMISDKTNLSKEEIEKSLEELVKENKIFYTRKFEKEYSFDGKIYESVKTSYFVDKDKFLDYNSKEKEKNEKKIDYLMQKQKENYQKLQNLSENAQKIYSSYDEISDGKAFISDYELREKANLNFKDYAEAKKELTNEKLLYGTNISKKIEGDIQEKRVVTKNPEVLHHLIEKEKVKKSIYEKEEKENPQKQKEQELER